MTEPLEFEGRVAVVTGGASGIGRALAEALTARGARVALLDRSGVEQAAKTMSCWGGTVDVSDGAALTAALARIGEELGDIHIMVSNAGIARGEGDHAASASPAVWQAMWDIHVMAHVHAANAVLPGMISRGQGHLVQVISAAGILNQVGDAAYSTTKHGALGFAEALAITHGDDGVQVTAVCPQYVATPMIGLDAPDQPGVLSAQAVAEATLKAMDEGRFLALPHPEVAQHMAFKGADPEGWIAAMTALRRKVVKSGKGFDLKDIFRLIAR